MSLSLDPKYHALLEEARQRQWPEVDAIHLCFQLLSLASTIDRDCAAQLAPYGLSEGRFVLLCLLDAEPQGVAPHQLAERAGVTRATITGLLDGMSRAGLLLREADPTDRRALRVRLTPAGQALAQQVLARHGHWIAQRFSALDADARQQLSHLLTQVAQSFTATPSPQAADTP